MRRSNAVVQMSQKLPHLNFPIREGQKSSYMYGLDYTGDGLNLENLEYHQSTAEHQPNLVLKFAYLKDLEDVDPFNISGVYGGKESLQGKVGVDVTTVIIYKNIFCGKQKTGDSLPWSWRRGVIQCHTFMAITAKH